MSERVLVKSLVLRGVNKLHLHLFDASKEKVVASHLRCSL